jgi:hypothetical protein
MKFYSRVKMPILGKEVRYTHLNNYHYFEILKFITNDDDYGLSEYFDFIISEIIIDKEHIKELTNLEKFLIFLDLRSNALGDVIQLNVDNGGKVDILLSSIKDKIIKEISQLNLCKKISSPEMIIDVCIPKSFIIDSIDKVYRDIIKTIKIDEDELNFFHLTESEIDIIINNIPASLTSEILDFIKINEEINKINIITENKKIGLTGISLNVFDKSMFLFIKSIFNEDLINFYEMQYALISKMNITYDHFLKMNMNECRIFINFYNRDMKKQQEEQNKSSSSASLPSFTMPSFPKLK